MSESNNYQYNYHNYANYDQNPVNNDQLSNKFSQMNVNNYQQHSNNYSQYQDNTVMQPQEISGYNNFQNYMPPANVNTYLPYQSGTTENAGYTGAPEMQNSQNLMANSTLNNQSVMTNPSSQMPPLISSMPPVMQSNAPYQGYPNQGGMRTAPYGNAAMTQQKTLKPDVLPSATEVIKNDQLNKSGTYLTGARDAVPPLVTTNFIVTDQGTCSPKFIRSTMYSMPATPDMMKNLHIPMVVSITPFAKLDPQENQIIISDMGEKGPIRCLRCKAYMSPLMTFIDGGRRFQCNLCGQNTEVTDEFFSHLDSAGRRMDSYQRPELCLGSYELLATKEYCKNDIFPQPPAFLFLIDVSEYSIKSGLLDVFCRNLKEYILPNLTTDYFNPGVKPRVGFLTYDRVIHFYNLKSGLTRPHMCTIPLLTEDKGENLVPFVNGLFVDPDEASDQITILMESISEEFKDTTERNVILGPVIQAGMEALKAANCSGKLFVLHSFLPNAEAPGKLSNRDDRSILGTDKEKTLFGCASDYYTNLGKSCVEAGVSIDLFVTPSSFMDIATLSELPKLTGGNFYKYDYFTPVNDEYQLVYDLCNAVSKPCAFDAVMKVRTSLGTKAVNYFGNFFMDYTEDVKLACIDSEKSVLVEIMHNDKLQENESVYVQVAVLFTSVSGQRRLRIHNTSFGVTPNMMDIFKSTELDTIMNYMCKKAVQIFQTKKPTEMRQELSLKTAQILAAYRRNYGEHNKTAELILPENLKLLPLYANCLIKCDFMQSDLTSIPELAKDTGTDLATDERAYQCFLVNDMNVKQTQVFLYPRLFNLKEIEEGSNTLPASVRDSYENLSDDGLFLLENGLIMYVWVGSNLDQEWMMNVFNCSSSSQIPDRNVLPILSNSKSQAIHRVIQMIRESRNHYLKLKVVTQGDKLEGTFKKFLVEDRNDRGMSSYVEFVYHIHKEIRTILNN